MTLCTFSVTGSVTGLFPTFTSLSIFSEIYITSVTDKDTAYKLKSKSCLLPVFYIFQIKLLLIQLPRVYYRSWLLRYKPCLTLKDLKNSKLIISWNIYFFKDILPSELIMLIMLLGYRNFSFKGAL